LLPADITTPKGNFVSDRKVGDWKWWII